MYASICNFGSYGASLIPVWLQNLLNYDHAMWLLYSVNLMSVYGYGGVMTNVPIFLLPTVLFYFGKSVILSSGFIWIITNLGKL
jgi:hypothetical protein